MIGSWSRKLVALVAVTAAAGALWTGAVEAGVILHEQEIVSQKDHQKIASQKDHPSTPSERVVQIEGTKEKITDKNSVHDVVVDVANNQTLFIHPPSKDYFLAAFPPKGETALWMVLPLITPPLLIYKSTGKPSSALGYPCQEYSADGIFNRARYSVRACFSTTAPGAETYSAFVKKASTKLGSFAPGGIDVPAGVPLWMRITQKIPKAPPVTVPPKLASASKKDTKQSAVPTPTPGPGEWVELETRNITVTSIQATKEPIPDGEFVPKGFQAKQPANIGF